MNGRQFFFRGEIPSSKSVLIRAHLMRVYRPDFLVLGESGCDDVRVIQSVVDTLVARGSVGDLSLDCGESGLVLRLMLGCVSRIPGEHRLHGSQRLVDRPHEPLFQALSRFGVRAWREGGTIRVSSSGWRIPNGAFPLDRSVSSQFASSLVLNSWDLPRPLQLEWSGEEISSGYLDMSLHFARALGMDISIRPEGVRIEAGQKIRLPSYRAEMDYSSAFAVAALGVVAGEAEISSLSKSTDQPDAAFLRILPKLGVSLRVDGEVLRLRKVEGLSAIREDLAGCPDLFPVLAVLCALAEGRSVLRGAPHLRHKESDRIARVAELLEKMGREVERFEDGLAVQGRAARLDLPPTFELDPEQDHRMVMAGAVAAWAGIPVQVMRPEVVSKSFPEFLGIAGFAQGANR